MSTLGIVIVNYRTAGLVVDCLRSLATEVQGENDWRVVMVENASGDGSVEKIASAIRDAELPSPPSSAVRRARAARSLSRDCAKASSSCS